VRAGRQSECAWCVADELSIDVDVGSVYVSGDGDVPFSLTLLLAALYSKGAACRRLFSPADSGARVWRYMDFTKFASLLDTNALFFSQADQLSDAWEGAYTAENLHRPVIWGDSNGGEAVVMDSLSHFHRCLRLHTFMSCWHLNDVESAAMWKLYVSHNEGIAIQTTFERLVGSFQGDESDLFQVYVGKVAYLDYEHEKFSEGDTFIPFLHKRLSFQHEHELRAIIQPIPPSGDPLTESDPYAEGLLVEIDLRMLIECIYVAPTSAAWFKTLVANITRRSTASKPRFNIQTSHESPCTSPGRMRTSSRLVNGVSGK